MVTTKRIHEAYRFYVYGESSIEEESINRYTVLRERLERILKANKLRSIQLAMGSSGLPFQFTIAKINNIDFDEFISDDASGKRRKEIYNKYN